MIKPIVHLNGTSAESLAEGYQSACDALGAAIDALRACAPNGRDYYVINSGAINTAQDEHWARVAAVTGARDEIARLLNHVMGLEDFDV